MTRELSMLPRNVARRAATERERERCKCLDCGNLTTGRSGEYYMVHEELWLKANPQDKGMLCVGCLEDRIGRQLTPSDFTKCPLNQSPYGKSERLLSRLQIEEGNEDMAEKEPTDMYDLLDAISATIAAAPMAEREKLSEAFIAFEDDCPDDFYWANGPQAPTLLYHLMVTCHPKEQPGSGA